MDKTLTVITDAKQLPKSINGIIYVEPGTVIPSKLNLGKNRLALPSELKICV